MTILLDRDLQQTNKQLRSPSPFHLLLALQDMHAYVKSYTTGKKKKQVWWLFDVLFLFFKKAFHTNTDHSHSWGSLALLENRPLPLSA